MQHFNICLPHRVLVSIFLENTDWEFLFVQNWRLASLGTLIGVPHTSIRFWDLRYFYDTRSFLQLPFPDLIAVMALTPPSYVLESGYKDYQLVEVEALRYMYLSSYSSTQHLSNNSSPSRPIQLLCPRRLSSQT